jgi:hypothetical protein
VLGGRLAATVCHVPPWPAGVHTGLGHCQPLAKWGWNTLLDFVKDVWNLDIFDRDSKYACALFACVLQFYFFSSNIFHTFDIYMLQMSFTHEETLI